MNIYSRWHNLKDKHNNLVVGLGNFDGVHIGHQKLISELVSLAKEIGGTPAVFTFNPHPLEVLSPGACPPQLLSQESKQKLIAKLGVEVLLQVPFDLKLAGMAPEDFIKTVLYEGLGARGVVVGYNYTFGHHGYGTPALLEKLSSNYGFQVRIIPQVVDEGQAVSSTLIRNLIATGDVVRAARLLGYFPFTEGQVVVGDRRGSDALGFPTANLEIGRNTLVPANGVYSVRVFADGDVYQGVANIGTKPTFHGKKRNVEVHILDFYQDLYGKWIKISFTRRLRGEKRFATPTELVEQIKRDILEAKALWSNVGE